jgi:hypothetical protein
MTTGSYFKLLGIFNEEILGNIYLLSLKMFANSLENGPNAEKLL